MAVMPVNVKFTVAVNADAFERVIANKSPSSSIIEGSLMLMVGCVSSSIMVTTHVASVIIPVLGEDKMMLYVSLPSYPVSCFALMDSNQVILPVCIVNVPRTPV